MELDYEITKDDYIEFNLDFLSHSKVTNKEITRARIIAITSIPLYFLLIILLLEFDFFPLLISGVGYSIFIIYKAITIKKSYFKRTEKRIRRIVDEGKGVKSIGIRKLIIEEDVLKYIGDEETIEGKLSNLGYVRETENTILLYRDEVSAYIVSKKAFKSQEELDGFKNMINSKFDLTTASTWLAYCHGLCSRFAPWHKPRQLTARRLSKC